jgi:hypothetical protein
MKLALTLTVCIVVGLGAGLGPADHWVTTCAAVRVLGYAGARTLFSSSRLLPPAELYAHCAIHQ